MVSVDLDVEEDARLVGYGDRGPAEGTLDPLRAVIALFDGDDGRVCLLALDALGVAITVADRVRSAVADAVGCAASAVLLSCTHTHAGPDWFDEHPQQVDSADRMVRRVGSAASELVARMEPAGLRFAQGLTDIGVNRRVVGGDGRAVMGINPHGPVDRRVGTVIISGREGSILGTITTAAAHANCLTGQNRQLSADFVAAFRDQVSASTTAAAMFVQGAAGDINPRRRGGIKDARAIGSQLARDVLRSLPQARPMASDARAGTYRIQVPCVPLPTHDQAERLAAVAREEWGQPVEDWLRWYQHASRQPPQLSLPADLGVIRLGDVYLAGVPWELFSQIGIDAATDTDDTAVFLCGYLNGYYGYLGTAEDHTHGGYEIDWMPITYGTSTGMPLPMAPEAATTIRTALKSALEKRAPNASSSRHDGDVATPTAAVSDGRREGTDNNARSLADP